VKNLCIILLFIFFLAACLQANNENENPQTFSEALACFGRLVMERTRPLDLEVSNEKEVTEMDYEKELDDFGVPAPCTII
jgi:hypothetical protein